MAKSTMLFLTLTWSIMTILICFPILPSTSQSIFDRLFNFTIPATRNRTMCSQALFNLDRITFEENFWSPEGLRFLAEFCINYTRHNATLTCVGEWIQLVEYAETALAQRQCADARAELNTLVQNLRAVIPTTATAPSTTQTTTVQIDTGDFFDDVDLNAVLLSLADNTEAEFRAQVNLTSLPPVVKTLVQKLRGIIRGNNENRPISILVIALVGDINPDGTLAEVKGQVDLTSLSRENWTVLNIQLVKTILACLKTPTNATNASTLNRTSVVTSIRAITSLLV